MSFVTTHPEALAATASNLQAIDAAMTAQNAAAATPITAVAPAAADEVSALQATQFSAYGQLYEQISAQAAAIQQLFIHTLRTSADSYGETESANSVAAGTSAGTGLTGLIAALTGTDQSFGLGGVASNSAILAAMQGGTIGSAASEFTGLGKGYITAPSGVVHRVDSAAAGLASQVTPAAPTGAAAAATPAAAPSAAAPAEVAVTPAPPAPGMSTPPNWAGAAAPAEAAGAAAPAALPSATTAHSTSTAAVPAGLPTDSGDRGSQGRLRYGVKPKVMPRPKGV